MYGVILTLISREFGIELPAEVLKKICKNAIVHAPWCADILGSHTLWCGPGPYVPRTLTPRTHNGRPTIGQVRLMSMRKSVDIALDDFIGEHTPYGRKLQKYTAANRKTQENMDIKAFCLDMERQHTKLQTY